MSKLSFTVEYFSDIEGEPYGIGSVPHTETLVQKMDESQSQFGARIVDFINTCNDPLTRLEARSVAVQFIADLRNHEFFHECMGFEKDEEGKSIYQKPIHSSEFVSHSVYLGADENEGDNSDNGHFVIDTDTGDFVI